MIRILSPAAFLVAGFALIAAPVLAAPYDDALRCMALLDLAAGSEPTDANAAIRAASDAWVERAKELAPADIDDQGVVMRYLGVVNAINDTDGFEGEANRSDAVACAAEMGLELQVNLDIRD